MRGKKFKVGGLQIGFLFGITAFRYFCEQTGKTIEYLDRLIVGDPSVDNLDRNHYWAVFVRCAAESFNQVNPDIEQPIPTVEEMEYLIDVTPQDDFDKVFEYYLDSSYVGKTMREHYGLVELPDKSEPKKAKKKSTRSAK